MARVVAMIVALVLAGCSLVNPHVFPDRPKPEELRAKVIPMDTALRYSLEAKDKYRGALRDQATLQSLLGIGLIPLSAAAIGLGATGGSPEAILALGLAGTSAFGTGAWLLNKPRQLAYVAGIKAVTCAEEAVAPLDVSADVRKELNANVRLLATQLPRLEDAANRAASAAGVGEALAKAVTSKHAVLVGQAAALLSLTKSATAEVEAARSLVASAQEARTSGVALQRTLDGAGRQLVIAVDKIADTVDGLIAETQRDPQALTTIISGLGSAYATFTTVPEGVKIQKPEKGEPKITPETEVRSKEALTAEEQTQLSAIEAAARELNAALRDLRPAVTAVRTARRIVADHVNSVLQDTPIVKLRACGVTAGDLVTALTVEPAQPIHVKKATATSFTIKGGLSPYGVGLVAAAPGLTVTQAGVFAPAVNVVTTAETPPGEYVINVTDGANHHLPVKLVVDPGEAPAAGAASKPPAGALESFVAAMKATPSPSVTVGKIPFTATDAKLNDARTFAMVTVDVGAVPKGAEISDDIAAGVAEELRARHGPTLAKGAVRIDNADDLSAAKLAAKAAASPEAAVACREPNLAGPIPDEPAFSRRPDADRAKIQAALCLSGNAVDGAWGRITKGRLMLYQCQQRREPDGALDPKSLTELLDASRASIAQRCGSRP
jgi:hypothetical protein